MFRKSGVLLANEKIDIQKSSYITNNNIQKECLKFSISALEEEYTLSFMAEVNHDKIINFPHRFIDFGKYLFVFQSILQSLQLSQEYSMIA